jgi:hypothetical protein
MSLDLRSAVSVLVALLLVPAAIWSPAAMSARAVRPTAIDASTSTSAATPKLIPFKMSFSGTVVSRARDELRLTHIVILGTERGEHVVFDCIHCRGVNISPITVRGAKAFVPLGHVIVNARSRLMIEITRAGSIGRFKTYKLDPRLTAHRLIHQGCLAINLHERISCSAADGGVLKVGPGAIITRRPSCPNNPCEAVSRVTGFQVNVGHRHGVSVVPLSGHIVAWEIALATPTPAQISYFDSDNGGPAEAGIAVLHPQPHSRHAYTLIAQSPLVGLQPYFGSTARFPLATALPVDSGDVIALTVPTWAPAIALGVTNNVTWRASRPNGQCSNLSVQASDTQIGSTVEYPCLYATAVLTYSATVSPNP